MIFQVVRTSQRYRTSQWYDEKPFKYCIPIKLTIVETRTFRTPEQFDDKFGDREGKWLNRGTNHRVDARGYITRDMGFEDAWGIEINSLEELMDFQEAVGEELVLNTSRIDNKTPCIEIYDDYRE